MLKLVVHIVSFRLSKVKHHAMRRVKDWRYGSMHFLSQL